MLVGPRHYNESHDPCAWPFGWEDAATVYPFLTLDDDTELVHSEMKPDGRVRVDIEHPDAELCFKSASCWLPGYAWENVEGFSQAEIDELQQVIESCAHLIIEFSQTGGFNNASGIWIGSYWVNTARNVCRIIECRSAEVVEKWKERFGEVRYYC